MVGRLPPVPGKLRIQRRSPPGGYRTLLKGEPPELECRYVQTSSHNYRFSIMHELGNALGKGKGRAWAGLRPEHALALAPALDLAFFHSSSVLDVVRKSVHNEIL